MNIKGKILQVGRLPAIIWSGVKLYVENPEEAISKVDQRVEFFGQFIVERAHKCTEALKVMDHETADKTRRYSLLGALVLDAYPLNPNAAQTVFMAMGLLGLNTAVEGYRTMKNRNEKRDECMTFNPITFSFKDFRESFTAQKNRKKEFGFNDSEEADRKRWVSRRVFGWPMVHIGVSNILLNGGARLKGLEAYWNDYALETSVLGAIALALFTWGAIKSNGSGVKKSSS